MPRRTANCQIMIKAVNRAARSLLRDFGEVENLQVSMKGPADFVSAADRRAEQILFDDLSKARPEYGFLMEEGGEVKAKDGSSRWIIDPLDGTSNFLHGIPHWAISIALEQRDEIVAGVVFDPLRDELFTTEKGDGVFLNDKRLRVSGRTAFDRAMIGCGLPIRDWVGRQKGFTEQMNAVADKCGGLRRLGVASLDLAYVAAGRQDGFWEYGLKPWDVAAGIMLVREAGGRVNRLEGDEGGYQDGTLVAGNGPICDELFDILKAATPPGH